MSSQDRRPFQQQRRMVHPMLEDAPRQVKRNTNQPSDAASRPSASSSSSSFTSHSAHLEASSAGSRTHPGQYNSSTALQHLPPPSPSSASPSSVNRPLPPHHFYHHHHHHPIEQQRPQPHQQASAHFLLHHHHHITPPAPAFPPRPSLQLPVPTVLSGSRAPFIPAPPAPPPPPPLRVSGYPANRPMPSPQVIDLTGSSPPSHPRDPPSPPRLPPRPNVSSGSRPRQREFVDVIDVDALPDRPQLPPPRPPPQPRRSFLDDDVQMLFVRSGSSRQPGQARPPMRNGHLALPEPFVQRLQGFRTYGPPPQDPILGTGGRVGQRGPDMGPNAPFFMNARPGFGASGHAPERNPRFPRPAFRPPHAMDYTRGVQGILRPESPPDAAAVRNADYTKPLPPRDGFTRSPVETDILVCVKCDHELGVESDTPKAGEVWAGKCGHCYCGSCAISLRGPGSSAGNKRTRRIKRICMVDGCNQNLGAKTGIFKIHL